jgi:peroxiredoxin/mono/diheme cytochrome c family protein
VNTAFLAIAAALAVDFDLPDADGRTHSSREWARQPILVLAFLGPECPVSRSYAARLNDLEREYGPRGVAIVGVDANPGDTPDSLKKLKAELGLGYPILRDVRQTLADWLAISRQPEVVVLDRLRLVRYRGRIDDQFTPSNHRAKPTRRDLALALDELLSGKPVTVARTEPFGCPLEQRSRPATSSGPVTYHRDVAPILNRHCVGCHQPGGIAPFSLRSASDAGRWGRAIREAVADRRMPPWHADPKYGHFANDPSLSEAQRRAIDAWVAGGSVIGDPSDAQPAPEPRDDGWTMQQPNLIVSIPEPFHVPAEGVLPYQVIEVDPGFKQDSWVEEAEIRPGNRSVVHHCNVYLRPPGMTGDVAAQGELNSFCLCAYALGTPPMQLPGGLAKKIPAGWRIVFIIHYVTTGRPQTDQTRLGLKVVPANGVRKEVATNILLSEDIKIPPHCPDYVVTRDRTFDKDVYLLSLFPHMHRRGASFKYEVRYPGNRSEVLLSVPKWDMDWQHQYVFAEPMFLPAGTVLTATAHYDNSEANPNNPDPDAEVRTGLQTSDEMFNGYYDFCLADQDLTQLAWRRRLGPPVTWCAVVLLFGIFVWHRRTKKS